MPVTAKRPAYLVTTALVGIGSLSLITAAPAAADIENSNQVSSVESANDGFADISDFEALGQLTQAESDALFTALENAPEELQQSEDPDELYNYLVQQIDGANSGPSTMALPAVILVARAVSCLAPSYVALRSISAGSPDVAAAGIAGAIAGCVTGGGASAIQSAILNNRAAIATGLRAIGLSSLAGVLAGQPQPTAAASATFEGVNRGPSTDPAAVPF